MKKNEAPQSPIVKWLLISLGTLSVAIGIIGIVLPVLPTTPFLLLAAACYAKSSERYYNWLISNRLFGEYIRSYREGNGVPLSVKVASIAFLWVTILISTFIFVNMWFIRIILLIIAVAVTVHIALIKSMR